MKNLRFCLLVIFIVLGWLVGIVQATPLVPMGLLTNNNKYLNISTYDGSNQLTHPCIIYNENGWNGYKYIMAITPYPYYNSSFENPSMRYSNDGITWVKIPGQPDPIIRQPPTGFYSDVSIELADNTLYLFYRWSEKDETSIYYNYTTSTDGINWTAPVQTNLPRTRSNSFIYNGTEWESWGHKITGSTTVFEHYTSTDAITWVKNGTISLDTSTFIPWHSEVKKYDNKYMVLMSETPYKDLRFFTSDDGLSWKFENNNLPVLYGRPGMWDAQIYKTSFVEINNTYRVWYSAYSPNGNSRVGYTQYPGTFGIIPDANFTANVTIGTAPLAVRFTDISTGTEISAWNWDFNNDGTVDNTLQSAEYTFSTAGNYSVNLTVNGTGGSDSELKTNFIRVNEAPRASFTITSPNGGVTWQRGTSHTVTWSYTGSPGSTVKIALLKAGAEVGTINTSTSIGSGGIGSYTWPISPTGTTGSDYKVKVQSISQPTINDTSNNYFSLTPATSLITVTAPNGGETWQRGTTQTINWSYTGSPGSNVKIVLLKAGVEVGTINASMSIGSGGKGSYPWPMGTAGMTGSDFKVKVQSLSQPTVNDTSNNTFTITSPTPTITVTSPNGGEAWKRGTTKTITWDYTGSPGSYVKIVLLKAGTQVGTINASTSIGSGGKGSCPWPMGTAGMTGSDFKVKVQSISQPIVNDTSNNNFSIFL